MVPKLALIWRDDMLVLRLRCPGCGQFADIDRDQYIGTVSLDCPNDACTFHETHDLRDAPIYFEHRGPIEGVVVDLDSHAAEEND